MTKVVIVEAVRSPIGSFGGGLSSLSGQELGARVIKAILDRHPNIPQSAIAEVIMGQVLTGGCGQNPARQAAINAGMPVDVPAFTIGKVCGSGLKAVALAAQSIIAGDANIVIAGGQESMSLAGHSVFARTGIKMGDGQLIDMMMKDGLTDAFHGYAMGITAENVAKKYQVSREEQDKFACSSQHKAEKAQIDGKFTDEIVNVTVETKKGSVVVEYDEFVRPGTTIETLAKLRPAFDKAGTVTAGNSSGINDGSAALLLMSEDMAREYGKKPMARIVSYASAGIDPAIMGVGPVYAAKKALHKAGWTVGDLDLIEANEAFAAQAIVVQRELGLEDSKLNVNGGAIALGHPIGASGARVLVTLLHEMVRRDAKKGMATLCIGGGMGIALCVARD